MKKKYERVDAERINNCYDCTGCHFIDNCNDEIDSTIFFDLCRAKKGCFNNGDGKHYIFKEIKNDSKD